MKKLLARLPDWSKTLDVAHQPDYAPLQAVALEILGRLPELRSSYRITDATLPGLREDGVSKESLRALARLETPEPVSEEELLAAAEARIGSAALAVHRPLLLKHTELWRAEVKAFSDQHCSPEMHLSKASGLYLLLRVLFDLPMACPRERAKIFAAITHPSVADRRHPFDLSWPVAVGQDAKVLLIHRMRGHMGRGYDAVGEYDYFVEHFPFRERNLLASLAFRSAPAR